MYLAAVLSIALLGQCANGQCAAPAGFFLQQPIVAIRSPPVVLDQRVRFRSVGPRRFSFTHVERYGGFGVFAGPGPIRRLLGGCR